MMCLCGGSQKVDLIFGVEARGIPEFYLQIVAEYSADERIRIADLEAR